MPPHCSINRSCPHPAQKQMAHPQHMLTTWDYEMKPKSADVWICQAHAACPTLARLARGPNNASLQRASLSPPPPASPRSQFRPFSLWSPFSKEIFLPFCRKSRAALLPPVSLPTSPSKINAWPAKHRTCDRRWVHNFAFVFASSDWSVHSPTAAILSRIPIPWRPIRKLHEVARSSSSSLPTLHINPTTTASIPYHDSRVRREDEDSWWAPCISVLKVYIISSCRT